VPTELLTLEQAAERLNVPLATLRFWRHKGGGPPSALIGRRVMYRGADLEAWLDRKFADALKGA
jgi:excisionase family DNA binding protein